MTYFFNGGEERELPGERHVLVNSQRDVPTYDLKPQMSARQVADAFLQAFHDDPPDFTVINLANADMVGHTGSIPATIIGVETIDACLQDTIAAVQRPTVSV